MKRAMSLGIPDPNKKANTNFSKALTSKIYQYILNICSSLHSTEENINEAVRILYGLDPCSTVTEGEFKGGTSLMLYCVLAFQTQIENLNIKYLKRIYTDIINYPNLDNNATCIGEGPNKGVSVLLVAADKRQWELVDKLIERKADINASCIGEGPNKGISVLWLAAYNEQWELVSKLIAMKANINVTCDGESANKGISLLWLAVDSEQWGLVDKLIEMKADINATCIGDSPNRGISVLWLAAYNEQWELLDKLIQKGADINATCTGEDPDKGKSVLWLAAYHKQSELVVKLFGMNADLGAICTSEGNTKDKSALAMIKSYNIINKDIFYLMLIIMDLRARPFEYPSDVVLTDEDKTIMGQLKNKINLYIRIFIPTTFAFKEDHYYKRNYLNDLPEEMRKLIAIDYIKEDLASYSLSLACIKYFSNEIANYLFNTSSEVHLQAQINLEAGPHFYELVLFNSILATLEVNSKLILPPKKSLNKFIFKDSFLPAFEKAKAQNKGIAFMNHSKRLELYASAKQYSKDVLIQKSKNTLTEDDFSVIFKQFLG